MKLNDQKEIENVEINRPRWKALLKRNYDRFYKHYTKNLKNMQIDFKLKQYYLYCCSNETCYYKSTSILGILNHIYLHHTKYKTKISRLRVKHIGNCGKIFDRYCSALFHINPDYFQIKIKKVSIDLYCYLKNYKKN